MQRKTHVQSSTAWLTLKPFYKLLLAYRPIMLWDLFFFCVCAGVLFLFFNVAIECFFRWKKSINARVWLCPGMFSSERHRGSLDDERRRLSRVLPGSSVYRSLPWPIQPPPPANDTTAPAHDDVTSGSRDELAPPTAKPTREYIDRLVSSTAASE